MDNACRFHPAAVGRCDVCGSPLCRDCLTRAKDGASYCGIHKFPAMRRWRRNPTASPDAEPVLSDKRWGVAVVLAAVGGVLGLHRFYLGRYVSGVFLILLAGVGTAAASLADGFPGLFQAPAWRGAVVCFCLGLLLELFFRHFREGFLYRKAGATIHPPQLPFMAELPGPVPEFFMPKSFIPAIPRDLVSGLSLAGLGVILICIWAYLRGHPAGERFYFLVFVACFGLSGIIVCGDWARLYWNGLTDRRGRPLR